MLNFFQSELRAVPAGASRARARSPSSRTRSADGAELYTVVYDDDASDGRRSFFADNGGDWPVVYDADGSIAVAFGVAKVPETWIIDPDGVVRGRSSAGHRRLPRAASCSCCGSARDEAAAGLKRWPGWVLLVFVVVGLLAVGATRADGPTHAGRAGRGASRSAWPARSATARACSSRATRRR